MCVVLIWDCCIAHSTIKLPHTTQQLYVPAQRLQNRTRFWVRRHDGHSMASLRSGRIERQNDPFPGLCESFSTLTVHIDCQSTATVDLHTANSRALNEPALCCIFAVSVPTSSLYPDVTHVINKSRPSPAFPYCKQRTVWWWPGNEAKDIISAAVT